jgi:16S rRNA (uracil1498-N3)-methyltransferase
MSFLPRIFLQQNLSIGQTFSLDTSLSHYLINVLRLTGKMILTGFDAQGAEYELSLEKAHPQQSEVMVRRKVKDASLRPFILTLGQGLPKGSKMDLILRQGSEVGIHQFIPILTRRSISRPEPSQWPHKSERWKKILIEACRQCGRNDVPQLEPLIDWEDLLKQFGKYDLILLPYEKEAPLLRSVLESKLDSRKILILIGPEGGWSREEVEQAQTYGAYPVHLPVPILRTETAGIVSASMIQFSKI